MARRFVNAQSQSSASSVSSGTATATPAFQAFVELLSRQPTDAVQTAREALSRALGDSDAAQLSNFARATRTDPYEVQRAREQLRAEQAAVATERAAIAASRSAAAEETAALREERRELEHVRAEIERMLPASSAARIQARVRTLRARLAYQQRRAAHALERDLEQGRAADERQERAVARRERADARVRDKAARSVQRSARGLLARRSVDERKQATTAPALQHANADVVRKQVSAQLSAMRQAEAATKLQAALRAFAVRHGVPAVMRLRARGEARRHVDALIARARAALRIQRAARGWRGRLRTAIARERASAEDAQRRQRRQSVAIRAKSGTKHYLRALAAATTLQAAARALFSRRATAEVPDT